MKPKVPKDPIEVLGEAYELMLERALEHLENAKETGSHAMHTFIDKARDTAVELEELTEEEADKVAAALKRDVHDAAKSLREGGQDFATWLGFDIELLGDRLKEQFAKAADPTTLELLELKEQAALAPYHTGELVGPGTLICDNCGEKLHFHKVSHIPPCPKCKGASFHREFGA